MFKKIFIICLLSFVAFSGISQEIKVNAKLDTNKITIGDQFHLTIELSKPKDANIFFPLLQDTIITEIEIVEDNEVDTLSMDNNEYVLQKIYTLTSFDSGAYIIEAFAFIVDSTDTIYTPKKLFIVVNTVAIDTTKKEIADIKQPFDAPMNFREFIEEYWPYITITLVVILALVLLFIFRDKLRPKKTEKPKPVKPTEPGYIIALRELELLKEKKMWQNNNVKAYYIELTDILRTYLYNQFDIYSLEMTTSETIEEAEKLKIITDEFKSDLLQVLSLADFVKFAKAQPLPDEHDLSYKNAYSFVEETKKIILIKKNNMINNKEEIKNIDKKASTL